MGCRWSLLLVAAWGALACGDGDAGRDLWDGRESGGAGDGGSGAEAGAPRDAPLSVIPERDESELDEPTARVGFVEVEPLAWTRWGSETYESSGARLFYRFVPADVDAKSLPVFVLFNGGPLATSMLLMSFGTGPTTLDVARPEAAARDNPHSLTQLGNLLYIDARDTGFSYLTGSKAEALSGASLNPLIDAADFVRVMLRVLATQPALSNNRVVLVGESYGGMRASLMLQLLLGVKQEGGFEVDLEPELLAHFFELFPGSSEHAITAEARALQFGHAVLIQPFMLGRLQHEAGSRFEQRAPGRCNYDTRIDERDCTRDVEMVTAQLGTPEGFESLLGVAPEQVDGLSGEARGESFRCSRTCGEVERGSLSQHLPKLADDDAYFMADGPRTSGDYDEALNGIAHVPAVLVAARYARLLITDAAFDTVAPGAAIVPALRELNKLLPEPLLTVTEDAAAESFTLRFAGVPDLWSASERTVLHPKFSKSGHAVTQSEPEHFFEVVRDFVAAP